MSGHPFGYWSCISWRKINWNQYNSFRCCLKIITGVSTVIVLYYWPQSVQYLRQYWYTVLNQYWTISTWSRVSLWRCDVSLLITDVAGNVFTGSLGTSGHRHLVIHRHFIWILTFSCWIAKVGIKTLSLVNIMRHLPFFIEFVSKQMKAAAQVVRVYEPRLLAFSRQ